MNTVERFDLVYIGDTFIKQIQMNISEHTCTFILSGACIHKTPIEAFAYEKIYQPATLEFQGVRTVHFPDYCLNAQIVDYSAVDTGHDGLYKFSFTMTGGWSNETFMRTIEVVAKDFSLTGTLCESLT